jgi:hypothetical protein
MPKYSPCRPHFMAPGPHVEILKDKPISFEDAQSSRADDGNDDEGFTRYKYYHSDKILGKLFDAVDERVIFERIQQIRLDNSAYKTNSTSHTPNSVLEDIWDHVQYHCQSTMWENHLDRARGIREE